MIDYVTYYKTLVKRNKITIEKIPEKFRELVRLELESETNG